MKDTHYTPATLASTLLSYAQDLIVRNAADFCVGGGQLLKAAKQKWPNVELLGTDISKKSCCILKQKFPDWTIKQCDFLGNNSSKTLKKYENYFDLIILNPPFTCKGGSKKEIIFDDKTFKVSTAMNFFLKSIKYLNEKGQILAILPLSLVYSEKDSLIRLHLNEKYNIDILEEKNNAPFSKCSPNIALISLRKIKINSSSNNKISSTKTPLAYNIIRGNISPKNINKYNETNYYFVHTTNLKNGKIINLIKKAPEKAIFIKGPALLIPRVGQPNLDKICIITKEHTFGLSDCIIAIKTKTFKNAHSILNSIKNNKESFLNLYKGTAAPYITLNRLKIFLSDNI